MPVGAIKDGDVRFARGMDSVSDAVTLSPEAFVYSLNMLNRGGALQTRPGFQWKFTLPAGQLQGLKVFTPRVGDPVILAFVSGIPYMAEYPFTSYKEVQGVRMSATAKQIHAAQGLKAVERNPDGSLKLIPAKALMVVQDGIAPAAIFDGRIFTKGSGTKKIPQGTHMAWSGARLWVARQEKLFASDIADPTSFYEAEYNTLGGITYFILPGKCTGLAPLPGAANSAVKTPLLAFTDSVTSMFRSNILNRASWATTEDFQSEVFPNLGCVAPRSIVAHAGMLWWYSDFGLVRLDSAEASNVSSKLDYIDREMNRSAKELSPDRSGIASATYENFLMVSVPTASKRNENTWVYDASVNDLLAEEFPAAWASIWTGISPVEWATVKIRGRSRLFCASKDADGQNRVYEAFSSERRDNGCDIPWALETRGYTGGTMTPKELRYVEYTLSELSGRVDLRIMWAGVSRGRWKTITTTAFNAQEGNVVSTQKYGESNPFFALKKQTRTARTQDVRDLPEDGLTSAGIDGVIRPVEADKENNDSAFQVRIEGSGPCAIRALRLFMDPLPEPDSGMAEQTEEDDHFVRADGASATTEEALREEPVTYTATKSGRAQRGNFAAEATATATSLISQGDADKRAAQIAQQRAEVRLRDIAAPYVGGSLVGDSSS